jgi:hypothetical protein
MFTIRCRTKSRSHLRQGCLGRNGGLLTGREWKRHDNPDRIGRDHGRDRAESAPQHRFYFSVIQVSTALFGLAWYQGDMQTNGSGVGSQEFFGHVSIDAFAVALPLARCPAPVVFDQPLFPDIDTNPPFQPLHTILLRSATQFPQTASRDGS